MARVYILEEKSKVKLQNAINEWLEYNDDKYEIFDVKYAVRSFENKWNNVFYSALILYRIKR